MLRALAAAGDGVAVIEAPAGMGKSRLLTEAFDEAESRVFSAGGDEESLLEPGALLRRLVPIGPGAPEEFLDRLERIAAGYRFVVCIDDVQWCDDSSARALTALARRVSDIPCVLVLATRPEPRSRAVAELIAVSRRSGRAIFLAPLDRDAMTILAREVPTLSAETLEVAGGHPFMLDHLARLESTHASGSLIDDLPLTADARRVVATCALLGDVFSLRDAARLEGRTAAQLEPILREAMDLGVLTEHGPQLAFSHDLWRESFATVLPRPAAAAVHREIAELRLSDGSSPLDIAGHLKAGAITTDNELAGWLRQAAREAAAVDPGAALDLTKCAAAVAGGEMRSSIEADLVPLLAWSDTDQAVRFGREMLARVTDPRIRCRVHTALALALSTAAQNPEGAAEARRALDTGLCTPAQEANLLVIEALGTWVLDPAATRAAARAAEARALELDQPIGVISALVAQVRALDALGRFMEIPPVADRAIQLLSTVPETAAPAGWRAWVLGAALDAAILNCDDDLALERNKTLLMAARKAQSATNEADSLGTSVLLHARNARWEEALADIAAWELLAADHPASARGMAPTPRRAESLRAQVYVAAEDPAARTTVDQWRRVADGPIEMVRVDVADARAVLNSGKFEGACDLFTAAIDRATVNRALGGSEMRLRAGFDPIEATEAACCFAAVGVDSLAQLATAYVQRISKMNPALTAYGIAADIAAVACGKRPASLTPDALEAVPQRGWRLRLARAGALALETKSDRRGASDLREYTSRLRQDITRTATGPAGSGATRGWAALTPAELRVVELVAEGLPNGEVATKLFLSRYTVESHLKRIFRKLGVRNRAELAALAARRR